MNKERLKIQMVNSYQEHRKEISVIDQKIVWRQNGAGSLEELGPSRGTGLSKKQVLSSQILTVIKGQDKENQEARF